jgi:iron complex transport system ATP-binding protein
MLEAEDLSYRVGGHALLEGVTASFAPGRLHMIVGPNGAGKSTLVKVLSRSLRPSSGGVRYGESDVSRASERELARRRVVLSQAVEVAFALSVREVVMMGRYPHFGGRPRPLDEEICDEVTEFFDLGGFSDRPYPTLSGGEKQRVNFARVLAQVWRPLQDGCRYLFLDEPLTFLDVSHQLDFMRKVKALSAALDMVVIGVVHDLTLAARFADDLLMLCDGHVLACGGHVLACDGHVLACGGHVLACGGPAEVLTSDHIRTAFHVEPLWLASADGHEMHLVFE